MGKRLLAFLLDPGELERTGRGHLERRQKSGSRLGFWELLGQTGKIHELTLFYYIMHDEPSRALSSENMHVIIPVFRPQYFVYLPVFGGRDVQNTDPVFPRTLISAGPDQRMVACSSLHR